MKLEEEKNNNESKEEEVIVKKKKSKKRKIENMDQTDFDKKNVSNKNKNSEITPENSKYQELWKNGERLWRENSFEQEYLSRNPDR
jgi:hypothetical protein